MPVDYQKIAEALMGSYPKVQKGLQSAREGFVDPSPAGAIAAAMNALPAARMPRPITGVMAGNKFSVTPSQYEELNQARSGGAGSEEIGKMIASFNQASPLPTPSAVQPVVQPRAVTLNQRIAEASANAVHQNGRVRIADIAERLPDVPLGDIHQSLLKMQDQGRVNLMRLDHGPEITSGDQAAALPVGKDFRHVFMVTDPSQTLVRDASAIKSILGGGQ